jgi:hypothetical protein
MHPQLSPLAQLAQCLHAEPALFGQAEANADTVSGAVF